MSKNDVAVFRCCNKLFNAFLPLVADIAPGDSLLAVTANPPGDPIYGKAEGTRDLEVKVANTIVKRGASGSPILNERIGAVCALMVRSRDTRLPAGAFALSISAISRIG